ncbi:MAG: carboxymuconolactone decarboxylase family protein [Anaerolineales bacterium]|nr:carboxymuconolactone decarboxylase family protein [Anaerolineales bacterium]MCB9126743.1 carboxymuconolactone decarboxylase family protein [Ardenticatenales bacterium]
MGEAATSEQFTPREKLALQLAEALTATPATVSDELYGALQREFDERELVELTASITWENQRARFNRAFDVQPQNFSEGQRCPLPYVKPPS